MTSYSDLINKDDDAHLLRAIIGRIQYLEKMIASVTPTGSIEMYGGDLRSAAYSADRVTSVGSRWSHWYRLNELSPSDNIYEDASGALADRITFVGATPPRPGQPGALVSDGSYSLKFDGTTYATFPAAAFGTNNYTLEVIFNLNTLPSGTKRLVANGAGTTGAAIQVTADGSLYMGIGNTSYDTGFDVVIRNWYIAVFTVDASSVRRFYLGRFNPVTNLFTIQSVNGGVSVAATAATGTGEFGFYDGWVDEVRVYNVALTDAQATDAVRSALQPAAPVGFLPADGSAVSRNKYGQLFRTIGTFNGAGDGSTTFNLPNYPGGIVKL